MKYIIDSKYFNLKQYIAWFLYRFKFVWEFFCCFLPVQKNKIVGSSFNGRCYGDNPGAIFDEIIKQKLQYDLVWLQRDLNDEVPDGVRKVLYNSWRALFELSTTKILINNVKNGPNWNKKKGQYYIQTWHGAFPLKYIEKEVESKLNKDYVRFSKGDSERTDLMLSGSRMISDVMRSSFWYTGEIMECGSPRNDILFNISMERINHMKSIYGISNCKKVLLYAPTFRDDGDLSAYNLDIIGLLCLLEERTNSSWICIVRLHPNVHNRDEIFKFDNRILDGNAFPDAQGLILVSDILITDYSSIMMDFGLMRKSVFLYVPDIEDYENKGRGLRPIVDQLPFPICHSNKEIKSAFLSFDRNSYIATLDEFIHSTYGSFEDGHASERVVERITNIVHDC